MPNKSWILSLALFAFTSNALAKECTVSSGPFTNALVELYTSEGCSSCPPADRWLSRLKQQDPSKGQVVPIALHVDYWDYIGWKDPFAKPQFSARQRDMAALGNARVVYTPQVALNGRDYRAWTSDARFNADIASIHQTPPKAEIQLSSEAYGEDNIHVSARIKANVKSTLVYYIALQEQQLQTAVKAGENNGETLRHDYVVRQWLGPFSLGADGRASARHDIPLQASWKKRDLAVVALVQNSASGEVVQALTLAGCDSQQH